MVTESAAISVTITPDGKTVLASGDPWYRLARAFADLFVTGQIDLRDVQLEEARWTETVRQQGDAAARQIWDALALTWMEPDCPCDPYAGPCACEPMDRKARLRELLGRG